MSLRALRSSGADAISQADQRPRSRREQVAGGGSPLRSGGANGRATNFRHPAVKLVPGMGFPQKGLPLFG